MHLALALTILLKMIKSYISIQFSTVCYAYMIHFKTPTFLYKPTCCMNKIQDFKITLKEFLSQNDIVTVQDSES